MAKKKADPLDQEINLTCLKCKGTIVITMRETMALKGARPICPHCGQHFDGRKAFAQDKADAEKIFAPFKAARAKLRRERAEKDKKP